MSMIKLTVICIILFVVALLSGFVWASTWSFDDKEYFEVDNSEEDM